MNLSADPTPLVPESVVTVTSTVPVPPGAVALIPVAEITEKCVATFVPKSTSVAPLKLLPLIVTSVPPAAGPLPGATAFTTGAPNATAKTTAVLSAIGGDEVEVSKVEMHGGGPPERACGETTVQVLPFHHMRPVPPLRLQSVIVREAKLLPDATSTPKYSPAGENVGAPTGSTAYCDTVKDPSPFASTVTPSLPAEALCPELLDVALAEEVEP